MFSSEQKKTDKEHNTVESFTFFSVSVLYKYGRARAT